MPLADRNRAWAKVVVALVPPPLRPVTVFPLASPQLHRFGVPVEPTRLARLFGATSPHGAPLASLPVPAQTAASALVTANLERDAKALVESCVRGVPQTRIALFGEPVEGKPFAAYLAGPRGSVTLHVATGGRVSAGPVYLEESAALEPPPPLLGVVAAARRLRESLSGSQTEVASTLRERPRHSRLCPGPSADAPSLERVRRPGLLASSLTLVQATKLEVMLDAFRSLFHREVAAALRAEMGPVHELVVATDARQSLREQSTLVQGERFVLEVARAGARRHVAFLKAEAYAAPSAPPR